MFKNIAMRTASRPSVRRILPLPKGGQTYKTDRALPKPDITCATDTMGLYSLAKI
jgi:hypothetical protein